MEEKNEDFYEFVKHHIDLEKFSSTNRTLNDND